MAGVFGIGLERGNIEMPGHDAADAGRDGGAEGNQFQMLQAVAVRFDHRKIDVRIRGGVAVAGKMFCGGQPAVFLHAANELA